MKFQRRIELMCSIGEYLGPGEPAWQEAIQRAYQANNWFTPEFTGLAANNIAQKFLQPELLRDWAGKYNIHDQPSSINVGIVMAGNIPLVGFHDMLAVFLAGHRQTLKLSSKDNILTTHLINRLYELDPDCKELISISDSLKNCQAYIATGSNNSSRYFEYYFAKYPHIIRANKTSIAILTGQETEADMERLSDDISLFFGLGCRNVTKIFVPKDYEFYPLFKALDKYAYFKDHNKYVNNYDYRLAILMLNQTPYLSNGTVLVTEEKSPFSPISMLHYETYADEKELSGILTESRDIQCRVGTGALDFGQAQTPGLFDYADGADTMAFLSSL